LRVKKLASKSLFGHHLLSKSLNVLACVGPPGPTTESDIRGDFLNKRQMPAIGGLPCVVKVSASGRQESQVRFCGFVSGLEICVSRKSETWFAETRSRLALIPETWHRWGHDIGFGIGIARRFATLGTIGFEGRFDYAAIGTVYAVLSSNEAHFGLHELRFAVRISTVGASDLLTR
jgi:hypothetical protein